MVIEMKYCEQYVLVSLKSCEFKLLFVGSVVTPGCLRQPPVVG